MSEREPGAEDMLELLAGPMGPILIFFLRVGDVSLGTLRFVYVVRGARTAASLTGFVEVLIWVVAAGTTILNLTSPLHVLGYAGGFGAGTWVGMWLEGRTPFGIATVQAYSRGRDSGVSDALRQLGLGVTEMEGEGMGGPVDIVSTVLPRKYVPRAIQTIEAHDPDAFITVYEARARRGWFPGNVRK
jgi:uncharacterized protein YebE (UPF0316 family)